MAAKKLGELLVEHGLVTRGQLGDALQGQMVFGGRLGTNLIELGYLSEGQLATFLSTQLGLPSVSPAEIDTVSKEALRSVSAEVASKYMVFPLSVSGRRLRLAMVDPTDLASVDEIGFKTGFAIQPAVAPEVLIVYALEKYYQVQRPTRYLRLDRSTEAQMMEAHRADPYAPPPVPDRSRRTAHSQGDDSAIALAGPDGGEAGASLEAVAAQLAETTQQARVLEIFRDALSQDFARVAVFGIKGAMAASWLQAGLCGSDEEFRRLSFPLEDGLGVTQVVRGRVPRLAQIGDSPIDKWLLDVMGASPTHQLLFLPVCVGEDPLLFAICDGLRAGLVSNAVGKYQRLTRKVAAALQMLNCRHQVLTA
jgi:hypothetical protein